MKLFDSFLISSHLFAFLWFTSKSVEGITGGYNADRDQFKYQVSIQNETGHKCGGAIIGEKYVLTAASCIINGLNNFIVERLYIVAGVHNLNDEQKIMMDVIEAYVPVEFKRSRDPKTNKNIETGNIAILKVRFAMRFDSNLNKLIVPLAKDAKFVRYMHDKATLTGFGVDFQIGKRNIEKYNQLRFAEVAILKRAKCTDLLKSDLSSTQLCAQVIQTDSKKISGACEGDVGSPLVIGEKTILGILIAIAPECNEKQHTGIYTAVTEHLAFINNVMQEVHESNIRVCDYRGLKVIERIRSRPNAFKPQSSNPVTIKKEIKTEP